MLRRAPALSAARILWSSRTVSDIQSSALRAGIVVKANSGCNQNLFLWNDPESDAPIKHLIGVWLSTPYRERFGGRYWPNVKQIVFGEEIIVSASSPLLDLNVFCCNGTPTFVVATIGEKTADEQVAYFTADGDRITSIMGDEKYKRNWLPNDFVLPTHFAKAIDSASILSAGIDFVRVDIMIADDRIYACEMTPFPAVGPYDQTDFIKNWSKLWNIRHAWFVNHVHKGFQELYRRALLRRLMPEPAVLTSDADTARKFEG